MMQVSHERDNMVVYTHYEALASTALAVFQAKIVKDPPPGCWPGEWRAYIAGVPGENHALEALAVLENGDPLREDVALLIFAWVMSHIKSMEGIEFNKLRNAS